MEEMYRTHKDVPFGWLEALRAALAARYRVIALDQRGHGDSDPPPDADAFEREEGKLEKYFSDKPGRGS